MLAKGEGASEGGLGRGRDEEIEGLRRRAGVMKKQGGGKKVERGGRTELRGGRRARGRKRARERGGRHRGRVNVSGYFWSVDRGPRT